MFNFRALLSSFLIFSLGFSYSSFVASETVVADFNGDGLGDILYRGESDLAWRIDIMNIQGIEASYSDMKMSTCCGWLFNGSGDFNNDGRTDVIIRNIKSGRWYIYNIDANRVIKNGYVPIEDAVVVGVQAVADFNNDGYADVLLRNEETGEWNMTLLKNRVIQQELSPPMSKVLSWNIVDAKDFDGNGSDDILIRNSISGAWYVYLYDNTDIIKRGYIRTLTSDLREQYRATGDFNGDGNFDVLMRNLDTGAWSIIYMNGLTPISTEYVKLQSSSSWVINSVNDFDADGFSDISLLHTETGEVSISLWNGEQAKSEQIITAALAEDKRGVTLFKGVEFAESAKLENYSSASYFREVVVANNYLDACVACHISEGEAENTKLTFELGHSFSTFVENYSSFRDYIELLGIEDAWGKVKDDSHFGDITPPSEISSGLAVFYTYLNMQKDDLEAGFPFPEPTISMFGLGLTQSFDYFEYGLFSPPIVSQIWEFGDGETSTEKSLDHTYPGIGHYEIVLKTTTDKGISTYNSRSIDFFRGERPELTVTPDVSSGTAPLLVNFTVSIEDTDSDSHQLSWDFGDGNQEDSSDETSVAHIFDEIGAYGVKVTIKDENGNVDIVSVPIVVRSHN